MGMIANYQLIRDEQLKSLKNFNAEEDDIFEEVEDWNEEAEILLDLDKMWDALHFVLTGKGINHLIKGNPLSEAVVGVSSIDDAEEFIAYTEKSRIADIVSALDDFDIEKAMENFNMEECKEAELYPDIWDYKEEADDIKNDLMNCFQDMKAFYKEVLEANGNVMVTIY